MKTRLNFIDLSTRVSLRIGIFAESIRMILKTLWKPPTPLSLEVFYRQDLLHIVEISIFIARNDDKSITRVFIQ